VGRGAWRVCGAAFGSLEEQGPHDGGTCVDEAVLVRRTVGTLAVPNDRGDGEHA